MDYKSIVVYLDNSSTNAKGLDFSINFSLAHQAHLTGLYVVYDPRLYLCYESYSMCVEIEKDMIEAEKECQETFFKAATQAGLPFAWHVLEGDLSAFISSHMRVSDLAIFVQPDNEEQEKYIPHGLQKSIVIDGGRPTLFLPSKGVYPTTFETVAIAWSGSRESARAVADAMPFLHQAKKVVLLIAGTRKSPDYEESRPGSRIAAHLSRHGIEAEIVYSKINDEHHREEHVTEWLLAKAHEHKADLLVSGAYGHNRLYEFVWGGVTQALLDTLNLPILMAH